jgi:hypothetical protein
MIKKNQELLAAIQSRLPELEKLLGDSEGHWVGEDLIYRMYHQSFKVYWLQDKTTEIVDVLRSLMPDMELNRYFTEIYESGTGHTC